MKPDANVQFLERFHLFSKAFQLLLSGGDSRDRTGDLLLARQALSQLSYIPDSLRKVVGPSGLEPPTLRLSVVRSSQLSYGPIQHSRVPVPSKLNNERGQRFALSFNRLRDCPRSKPRGICFSRQSDQRYAGVCSDFLLNYMSRFARHVIRVGSGSSP